MILDTKQLFKHFSDIGKIRVGINLSNFLLVSGKDSEGMPSGVAPDMARAISDSMGCKLEMICFPNPGSLADAVSAGAWDVGLIAAEPARAELISFTPAYVEIEATYMVKIDSGLVGIGDIDKTGVRISVAERSAYDLYLTRTLKAAEVVRAKGLAGASQLFADGKVDVLAGLRPGLLNDAAILDGKILEGRFTTVQQAVGTPEGNEVMVNYLTSFVQLAKKNGLVESLIKRHGMEGKLLVAGP